MKQQRTTGGRTIYLPDRDYSCASAYCDDPACNLHGAKDQDGTLLYWNQCFGTGEDFAPGCVCKRIFQLRRAAAPKTPKAVLL